MDIMRDITIYTEVSDEIRKMNHRKRLVSLQRAFLYFRYHRDEQKWFDKVFKVTWSRRDCFHLLKIRDVPPNKEDWNRYEIDKKRGRYNDY